MAVVFASVAFWTPVIYARIGDNHEPEVIKFKARFRRLKKSERIALDRRLAATTMTADLEKALRARIADAATPADVRSDLELQLAATPISDTEFLNELLVDWDLVGADQKLVPYSQAVRQQIEEELDGIERALVTAYFDAKRALTPEAIAKNSGEPSATGS